MIGINYGDKFPWEDIKKDEAVYMVDFSLPFEEMIKLYSLCNHLVWIDHHKTAIKEEEKYYRKHPEQLDIIGYREIGIGACALTWRFLYPNRKMPFAVKLLAEHDVWDHSDPATLPFQYGMRIRNTLPESPIWNNALSEDYVVIGGIKKDYACFIRDINMEGKAILKYVEQNDKRYAKGAYFYTKINRIVNLPNKNSSHHISYPYKCIAINKALANSMLFNSVKTDEDIMIAFHWNGSISSWMVSLYTENQDIDVSEIAEKFGGGGHKGAAGFMCDYLPFILR